MDTIYWLVISQNKEVSVFFFFFFLAYVSIQVSFRVKHQQDQKAVMWAEVIL